MDKNLETINGCLGDGHTDKDWKITGEMLDELPELEIQDKKIFEYNQGSSPDCTLYSALGALSDLFNRELTPAHFEEANEESFKRWRVPGEWRYTKDAVDCSCDLWMKRFPEDKVAYYRISNYDDETIKKVIEKNYSLCTSFNGNSAFIKDRREDGKIDEVHSWPFSYWHAVCLIGRDDKKFVKDNYKGRKENWRYTNIYEIVPDISALRKNACRQFFSYLIVKVNDGAEEDIKRLNNMKNLIEKIEEHSEELIPLDSQMRESTHDKEYQEQLHIVNEALRKLKKMNEKKKKDIETELSKYFIS